MHVAVDALSSFVPILQNKSQHESSIHIASEWHQKAIEVATAQHEETLKFSSILHERDCALERELHCTQLSHDMLIARREGVRDMWAQRSQQTQTLMIIDTLMFSCAYAVVVQGDLPLAVSTWVLRLYATMSGVALTLLFVSIWFSIKLQTRMAMYDMHRPHVVYTCGRRHRNFHEYYLCHCRIMATFSFATFYCGTIATLLIAAIFVSSKLTWEYDANVAAILFLCISLFAIVIPFVLTRLWVADDTFFATSELLEVQER